MPFVPISFLLLVARMLLLVVVPYVTSNMPFVPSSFLLLVARMLLEVLPFVTSSDALCS